MSLNHNISDSELNSTNNSSFYGIITEDVMSSKKISRDSKLLYVKIVMYSNKYGHAWPSNKTLAEYFDVDERTIKRWLQELKESNFIFVDVKKRGMKTERKIYPNLNANRDFSNNVCEGASLPPSRGHSCPPTKRILKETTIKESNLTETPEVKPKQKDSSKKDSIPPRGEKEKKKAIEVDLNSPYLIELLGLEDKYLKYFAPTSMRIWIQKFGVEIVLKTVKLFLSSKPASIRNPGAWMEIAFMQKYTDEQDNKDYVKKIQVKYNLKNMLVKPRYVQNTDNNNEIYFKFDHETFKDRIKEIFLQEIQDGNN